MQEDWKRDPIWQTIGVVVAAVGLIGPFILTPSLPYALLVIVGLCICVSLLVSQHKQGGDRNPQKSVSPPYASNKVKAPSYQSALNQTRVPAKLTQIRSSLAPPPISGFKRFWLTIWLYILYCIGLLAEIVFVLGVLISVTADYQLWFGPCKGNCGLSPGLNPNDVRDGSIIIFVLLSLIFIGATVWSNIITKKYLMKKPAVLRKLFNWFMH